ncbi:CHAD domain-containing protein [Streptomyces sp. NPDC059909]|uniref:CHAD domain-containing protein n=1 Tax=Streptomyces sp. NPDC059909 TaxID=3346998 RepID=UPI003651572C
MHSPDLPLVPRGAGADQVLAGYLHTQAADFLRSLRLHGESGADTAGAEEAARALRRAARRIGGTLHTYRPLLEAAWADQLRTELAWLSGVLAQEHACTARLNRLLDALARLSGTGPVTTARAEADLTFAEVPAARTVPGGPTGTEPLAPPSGLADPEARTTGTAAADADTAVHTDADGQDSSGAAPDPAGTPATAAYTTGHGGTRADARAVQAKAAGAVGASPAREAGTGAAAQAVRTTTPAAAGAAARGALTVGAARAGALLERQLTLGRTRAHSAALQVLGSSRFHAVADAVALLASEVPLAAAAAAPADVLDAHAETAERRLLDAVATLPLARAAHPYNADALVHGLATTAAGEAQDAPWHHVRMLLRLHRYAQEVTASGPGPLLTVAARALDRHRDAAEAASAAASAARTPRIAPATAYALGVLHADQRHEVEAARFTFHQVWRRQTVAAP